MIKLQRAVIKIINGKISNEHIAEYDNEFKTEKDYFNFRREELRKVRKLYGKNTFIYFTYQIR